MIGDDWRPTANRQKLRQRATVIAAMRRFFAEREVLEVETPLLSLGTTTEPHIDSLAVPCAAQQRYLQSSPEFAMKRLLAAGSGSIYQIGKAFRAGERGTWHNPEFTLLEWYRVGFDHHALMDEVAALLACVASALGMVVPPAKRWTYRTIFQQALAIDPLQAATLDLAALAQARGISVQGSLDRAGWLDLLMSECVASAWPGQQLAFVYDYPAVQASLARVRKLPDGYEVAERFEVYWGGCELANGFAELTDADELSRRTAADQAVRRARAQTYVAADARLLAAMRHGLPACAGVALGVDRLLLALGGASSIDEVIAFPWEHA